MIATDLFSRVPLFEGIAPEDRAAIAKAATAPDLPAGRDDRPAGPAGGRFFVIVKGRVAVTIVAPDGREVVLNSLGEGDHFGEMALLDDAPRSASVVAQERSELAILRATVFFDLLRSNFVLTRALLASFSRRLRRANATIEGLASLDVKSRLARYFRELADVARPEGGRGLVRRRPPVAARDRRHDRLQPRDGLPDDVPDGGGAAHRPEGDASSTCGSRRADAAVPGPSRALTGRAPWSSAPGPCRIS